MNIIISKRQLSILVEQYDDFESTSGSVTYSFDSMKPWKNQSTGNWYIYFNGGKKIEGNLDTDYGDQIVYIKVGGKTYEILSGEFVYRNNTGSVDLKEFKKYNPKITDILFPKDKIKSNQIREALFLAFPNNWEQETNYFTPGLRGIYTIGEKLGTDESWSIMNYFDTKEEIKDTINQSYSKSKDGLDIVNWLVEELRNNDSFVKTLVDRQWTSIKRGFETEELAKDMIQGENVIFYPPGSKMDRYGGVDLTIDGVNYQVKPLISYDKKENTYVIRTYGMRDYSKKELVDKILFVNPNEILIFDNKNYTNDSNTATFYSSPEKIDFN
jgi:hypothetical protein